jgi:hypothetical protein
LREVTRGGACSHPCAPDVRVLRPCSRMKKLGRAPQATRRGRSQPSRGSISRSSTTTQKFTACRRLNRIFNGSFESRLRWYIG